MSDLTKLSQEMGLPAITQVGVVVADVERAAGFYSQTFGLGPFTIYEFAPDRHWYKGELSPLKVIMAKAMWGPVEYELIQPLEGRSLHLDFLETKGEGLQHLGLNVSNYDQVFKRMVAAGFEPVMRAESYVEQYQGLLKACYFDTREIGGVLLEVIWRSWQPECNP